MVKHYLITRPAFEIIGKKTWISGQDNALFGKFWDQCREEGLFERFQQISALQPGPVTNAVTLGISCVENDPQNRSFDYFIAIEKPAEYNGDLETRTIPAAEWAVFESRGKMPEALVAAEMYAFMEWLPSSGYIHAAAPEMEVYPPHIMDEPGDVLCEFWLPVEKTKV
jgi:AraC family transcriptional regulator